MSDHSSSDFSSDEDEDALPLQVTYDPSLVPHVLEIEELQDPAEAEISDADATALLASLRADGVADALLQALAPVLTAWNYNYDAYTTALYYLSSLWPEDAPTATQRSLVRVRIELYRRFHTAFPLTPDMYSEYIGAVDSVPHKLRLYEQAARDYWSVARTIEYLTLLNDSQDDVPGVTWATVQRAIDTALATVGHHYTSGHDVWTTARELTAQHFDDLDGDQDAAKETAMRALFVRQMKLPLQQNDLAMSEFRAWHQYNTLAPTAARDAAFREAEQFQQRVFGGAGAVTVYKKLNQFEARLAAALAGTLPPSDDATESESPEKVWTQYLRYAQFKLAPVLATPTDADRVVVCLFERAVASVCLSSSLWSQYIEYVATHHPLELPHVAHRATRNASFDSAFWVERLLAMEASGDAVEQIRATIETDLLNRTTPPLMDSAHMARALANYCGVVRRLSTDAVDAVDAAVARCRRFLETAFGADETPVAALLTFQAQFLAFEIRAETKTTGKETWRSVWHEILRIRGAQADAWLSFYDEYRFTHASSPTLPQELRDVVFAPAVARVQDYPLLVLERWLAFEGSVGDRAAYAQVRQRYQSLVQRLQYQATVPAPQETQPAAAAPPAAKEKPVSKKRKAEPSAAEPTKRQKPTIDAPVVPVTEPKKKTERFTNDYTLFVCNVTRDATKEELQTLFAHIPTLQDVRLVVKERGTHVKSRGMAYVQFSDDAGVAAGLAVDGTDLHGQPIKVERSTPPSGSSNVKGNAKSTRDVKGGSGAKGATTTMYVGGLLPPEREPITEDELKTALTEMLGDAAVKQVLILTDRRGRPKEYGLVEVTNAKLVGAAVQKQHELQLKLGDQVTVQTSRMTIDQVVRHRGEQKQATQQAKDAKQGGSVEKPATEAKQKQSGTNFQAKTAPHAKPHARLAVPPTKPVVSVASLMPRALRKKTLVADATTTPASTTATTTATASETTAPKTNADFRKFFMN